MGTDAIRAQLGYVTQGRRGGRYKYYYYYFSLSLSLSLSLSPPPPPPPPFFFFFFFFSFFLQVDPCLLCPFYELAGGYLILKRDELTERAIVDSWVACALSPTCLCSDAECQRMSCWTSSTKIYSRCHRYDQTALALILVNLFDYRVSSLVADRFRNMVLFHRGNRVHFFPEER